MLAGLWTVEFRSSIGSTGYGTVTFDDRKARGGTAGYYYVGNYEIEKGVMHVLLRVRRFNTGVVSVFGPLEDFEVQLSGAVAEPKMIMSGRVVDRPTLKVAIVCVKREDD
jgi:hypothetical protein